jgi:hypothetical protein
MSTSKGGVLVPHAHAHTHARANAHARAHTPNTFSLSLPRI